jgi:diguanylate cyclase (GGDEF)-like protein
MTIERAKHNRLSYASRTGASHKTLKYRAEQRLLKENILLRKKLRQEQARSETDALTGVGNMHKLAQALKSRGGEMTRWPQPLSIVFVDVNDLKKINDKKDIGGHKAGDEAIIGVARKLKSMIRSYDTLCRKGGDEFVIVTVNNEEESDGFVKRLKGEFINNPVIVCHNPVGVAIGKATLHEEKRIDEDKIRKLIDNLVEKADKDMYEDKRRQKAGR